MGTGTNAVSGQTVVWNTVLVTGKPYYSLLIHFNPKFTFYEKKQFGLQRM